MKALPRFSSGSLSHLASLDKVSGRILRETRRRPSYVVAETEADRRSGSEGIARIMRPAE